MSDSKEIKKLHQTKTVAQAADKTRLHEFLASSQVKEKTAAEKQDYESRLARIQALIEKKRKERA